MYIFVFCVFYSLIPYILADPSPDFIHIQNYDGPIFLQSPKPNCCPLCNSLLTPQNPAIKPDLPCESAITEGHLRNQLGANEIPNTNLYGTAPANAYTPLTSGNQFGAIPGNAHTGTVSGDTNLGTLLHTNSGPSSGIPYSVPLTSRNAHSGPSPGNVYTAPPFGNTFNTNSQTGNFGNPLCGANQPTITTTECTCVTKPVSSYLPINTSQNTGSYKLPIAVGNNQVFGAEEEPVLVPQKFSYSLILDGEVAPTFNQNGQFDYRYY